MDIKVTCRTPHLRSPGILQRGSPAWLQAAPTSHVSAKERPTVTCRESAARAPRGPAVQTAPLARKSSPRSHGHLCISPQKWGLGHEGGSGHPSFQVCKRTLRPLLLTDYARDCDCVDHNMLRKILQEMGISDHLTCLLRNLCAAQEATVRTGHGTTDWFQIGKGVHQGCVLSTCSFNLHEEHVMRNTGLDEAQAGIKIARGNINNLR